MKVAELRDWCGACSLGEKGNKDALIGRLKEARSDGLRSPGGRSGGPTTPQKQTVSKAQSQAEQRRKQIEKLFQKYSSGAKEIGMEGFLSLGLDLAGGSEEMSSTPEHTFFLFVTSLPDYCATSVCALRALRVPLCAKSSGFGESSAFGRRDSGPDNRCACVGDIPKGRTA